jgi:C4-dicarboxylate-binding protein DctP
MTRCLFCLVFLSLLLSASNFVGLGKRNMITGRVLRLVLAALLLPIASAGAEQVKLKAAMQVSVRHPLFGVTMQHFKDEAERLSKDTLSIEIVDEGRLAGDPEMAEAVSSGKADIGIAASAYLVPKVPSIAILELPFLFNFRALTDAATRPGSEFRRLIEQDVSADGGMHVLLWQPLGEAHFSSKRLDVAEVGRLKDRHVALVAQSRETLVEGCGGRPTTYKVFDLRDALMDGKADVAQISLWGMKFLRMWDAHDVVTLTAHYPVEFLVIIGERRWQALSPEHRAALTEAASIAEREGHVRMAKQEAEIKRFAVENGVKFVSMTPNQVADWRACTAHMVADYMERIGTQGLQLMNAYRKLRTDPCCSASPHEGVFTQR